MIAEFEAIREYTRNLWRSQALREREHYALIALIDKAERAAEREREQTSVIAGGK